MIRRKRKKKSAFRLTIVQKRKGRVKQGSFNVLKVRGHKEKKKRHRFGPAASYTEEMEGGRKPLSCWRGAKKNTGREGVKTKGTKSPFRCFQSRKRAKKEGQTLVSTIGKKERKEDMYPYPQEEGKELERESLPVIRILKREGRKKRKVESILFKHPVQGKGNILKGGRKKEKGDPASQN